MDALDKELAKLKLQNSRRPRTPCIDREAAIVPSGKVVTLAHTFQQISRPYIAAKNDALLYATGEQQHLQQQQQQSSHMFPEGGDRSPKKVGPSVPPKPQKQYRSPEVPQSLVVEELCKPLYSKRLQCCNNDLDASSSVSTYQSELYAALNDATSDRQEKTLLQLHRKPTTSSLHSNNNHKINKVTLDNPVVLEQQLEALAHHKMQLERKGLLQQGHSNSNKSSSAFCVPITIQSGIPKLSTSSFLSELKCSKSRNDGGIKASIAAELNDTAAAETVAAKENSVYTNMYQTKPTTEALNDNQITRATTTVMRNPVYSNDVVATSALNEVCHHTNPEEKMGNMSEKTRNGTHLYYNLIYENAAQNLDALPLTAMPSTLAALTITTSASESADYIMKNRNDEIPPPPSPLSSSYSELHRATANVFSNTLQHQQQLHEQQLCYHDSNIQNLSTKAATHMHYGQYIENPNESSIGAIARAADVQQSYMNMNYSNEYTTFNDSPSSQNISQSSSAYCGYGGSFSQASSTYESIYEPINPRPASQLSASANYLLYMHYANSPQIATDEAAADDIDCELLQNDTAGATTKNHNDSNAVSATTNLALLNAVQKAPNNGNNHRLTIRSHNNLVPPPKEVAEVEALTNFLVHSIHPTNDVDSYGVCVKCNECVVGENSGCTAMDQVYHIACFTCSQCQINLQGKPFYALDCKPYCEYDYLQTLEKCSICMRPILERILRATGKPYHPQCFTCVVCGNSLDGIPFTVDATNQNYCIADFHKKFAPRCCVCKEPIMPEPGQEETVRVVALDRSFHFKCYKCEDCGLLLSSEAEGRGCYPLDNHVLCKSCNAQRVQTLTQHMTTDL